MFDLASRILSSRIGDDAPRTRPPRAPLHVGSRRASGGPEKTDLIVGFLPLLDCAPFAVAQAEGLFGQEQLRVVLSREASWSAVSDGIRSGRLDAAQMLAPMPFAERFGKDDREPAAICTAMTLSRGGNAITLGYRLREYGVSDRATLRRLFIERKFLHRSLPVFGIVHPASMHNLLLRCWLSAGGIDPAGDVEVKVIPPPQMVTSLQQGTIAGYSVGEPWNTRAVRAGLGFVCASDRDIWPDHPEKVLGVAAAWADAHPRTHLALVRALLRACQLCDDPEYRARKLPKLLCQRRFLAGIRADCVSLFSGPTAEEEASVHAGLLSFSARGANRFRAGEIEWIMRELARFGICTLPAHAGEAIAAMYRGDVLREAADGLGLTLASATDESALPSVEGAALPERPNAEAPLAHSGRDSPIAYRSLDDGPAPVRDTQTPIPRAWR